MLKHISSTNGRRRTGAWRKLGLSAVMLLTFAVTASAYTLVFRNGERLDIPDYFTVTQTTLTYEISPGFNKTILLSLVDVAATERANRESRGSFFRHRESPPDDPQPDPVSPPARTSQATKTLTNSDLAGIRQRRLESEKNYEARRRELGLPTIAETRMRQEAEGEILRAQIRENNSAKSREEGYWRGRARELRTEIATVDNQINYVRARLNEVSGSSLVTGSFTNTYPIWPEYRSRNGRWGNLPNRPGRLPRTTPPIYGPQPQPYGYPNGQWPNGYPNRQWPNGYPSGQWPNGYPNGQWPPYGYPNNQYPYPYPNQSPYGFPGYGYPNGQYPYGYPSTTDNSAQAADLQYRLDDLLTKRAGLLAQWQALEDEARDARIPQVWLEP